MRGEREGNGERGTKYSSQEPKVQEGDTEVVPKMSGLYREEPMVQGQPGPWAGEFSVEGRVCQPYPVTGWD